MIPTEYIQEWRGQVPWAEDAQIEQDLVICRALVEIYSDPFLHDALAFRGGTALHKLYINPPERYSEDIDLVQIRQEPIGPTLSALRSRLDPWLGEPKRAMGESMVTLKYRFLSESMPPVQLRLKVEINGREHGSVAGLTYVPFEVRSSWFDGRADVTTFTLEELLATKLRALYQRKKGRDAFDLDRALTMIPSPDRGKIITTFLAYMARSEQHVSRAEFEQNLDGKRRDLGFLSDISALLATEAPRYDPIEGLERIERELVSLLPGAPWQRPSTST